MCHKNVYRFADMYRTELREEVELAHSLHSWTNATVDDIPSATDSLKQLADRLRALKTWSSANMQGRWFSMYDSAKNSLLHWTGMLCAMTYRLMKICDLGFVPYASNDTPATSVLGRSRMDEGILRCSLGLLANSGIRRSVMTYVITLSTFRSRAGMRTKNSMPPGMKGAHVPLPAGPAVTIARVSSLAAGEYIDELNETINSIEQGDLAIDPNVYKGRKSPNVAEYGANPPVSCHETLETDLHGVRSKLPFVQPGQFLADHLLARLRSGAIYSFGCYSYAAMLHPSLKVASMRYEVVKNRAAAIRDAMSANVDESAIPSAIKKSLMQLCRDDVYMDFATRILSSETVHCCRAPYQAKTVPRRDMDTVAWNTCEDDMDVDEDAIANDEDMTSNQEQSETAADRPEDPTMATEDHCHESCSCHVLEPSIGKLSMEVFGAINGTKWLVENAFNKIRAASKACSRTKRGRAEMTREAMLVSQYSNTLIGCKTTKNVPLRLDLLDWSDNSIGESGEDGISREDFTCQHMRGYKALYNAMFELLGWSTTLTKANPGFHQFTSIPPNEMLNRAIAEEFITTVPKCLWRHAYKTDIVPRYSVIYNLERDEYRFILGGKKESLAPSWPCVATVDTSLKPPRVLFSICQATTTSPEELFIFPYVESSTHYAETEQVPNEYKWVAVRTEASGGPINEEDMIGNQLTIAISMVPRQDIRKIDVVLEDGTVIPEMQNIRYPNLPHSNILEYVPLIEWSIESGMPGCAEERAKKLLAEVLIEEELREMDTPHGNHDGMKLRLRKKVSAMGYTQVFSELMDHACRDKDEDWRASCMARYYLYFYFLEKRD